MTLTPYYGERSGQWHIYSTHQSKKETRFFWDWMAVQVFVNKTTRGETGWDFIFHFQVWKGLSAKHAAKLKEQASLWMEKRGLNGGWATSSLTFSRKVIWMLLELYEGARWDLGSVHYCRGALRFERRGKKSRDTKRNPTPSKLKFSSPLFYSPSKWTY